MATEPCFLNVFEGFRGREGLRMPGNDFGTGGQVYMIGGCPGVPPPHMVWSPPPPCGFLGFFWVEKSMFNQKIDFSIKNKFCKISIFYKKCNLVINHHLLRRVNSSLPQGKSPQKTVQDTMVKRRKIEIFENFENPYPGKSCLNLLKIAMFYNEMVIRPTNKVH